MGASPTTCGRRSERDIVIRRLFDTPPQLDARLPDLSTIAGFLAAWSMTVLRVVPNLPAPDPATVAAFNQRLFGLTIAMDHGWIVTLAADNQAPPQLSLAAEGGAGAPVPDLSIEVDDLPATLARARAAGLLIDYGPVTEPWGVVRFFIRDPTGRLLNILSHA